MATDVRITGIIYASVTEDDSSARQRLQTSVSDFVETCGASGSNIWSLTYAILGPDPTSQQAHALSEISPHVFSFAPRPNDLSFPDEVLTSVKQVWKSILGVDAQDDAFLRFEERETEAEND
jgi:hypothetical protein